MVTVGVRTSSTGLPMYDMVYDDTSNIRFAVEGGVGHRFGRVVVGAHGGISTSLQFASSPLADSGEQVAYTETTIYPLDLGVGAQIDLPARFWISAWLGATLAFAHARSPAAHINAIDYTGDIPAASWRQQTTSLGFGAGIGYDLLIDPHGRIALLAGLERQGIGTIPVRENAGATGSEPQALTTISFTLGVAYHY